jgi:hypothetical protein
MPINYDELGNVINSTTDEVALAPSIGTRSIPGVPAGAMPEPPAPPVVQVQDLNGKVMPDDNRVRILVPPKYITPMLEILGTHGGILFPYTPSVSYEAKADYSSSQPLHSNFAINFYQRSNIGNISISGKFSVETADDALMVISTMHMLKALTRMRSGGDSGDPDSGAPPPVCRLFANGEGMLYNVPVAITSYRIEMPDSVDYFTLKNDRYFGTTAVPTVSTIAVTCMPMYSRAEMQNFSVSQYINGSYNKGGFI